MTNEERYIVAKLETTPRGGLTPMQERHFKLTVSEFSGLSPSYAKRYTAAIDKHYS